MNARRSRPATVACRHAVAALTLLAAVGCQSYEARPVDVERHRDAFLARTAELPGASTAEPTSPDSTDCVDAGAPASTLTLDRAEQVALVFNARLRKARRDAGIAQASADNAGLWQDPTISLQFTRLIDATTDPNELFGGFGLSIPISGRLEVEKARLGLAYAARLAEVAGMEWRTRMELREAWIRWSALQRQVEALRQFVTFLDGVVDTVERLAAAGEVARIDARLFRLERTTAHAEATRLEARARQAELQILHLMGLPPSIATPLQPVDPVPQEPLIAEMADAALQTRILSCSPELLVAKAEYEVAERRLEQEIREQLPDLQVSPNYGTQDGDRQFLLGLSIPLPILNANRQAIAEAAASRESARVSIELELERAIAAVSLHRAEMQAAGEQGRILHEDLLPLAELEYREAREVAALGELNTLAMLESLKRRKDAQVSLIEARRDEALAEVDIRRILGPDQPPAEESKP